MWAWDYCTHDASARPAFMRWRGEPFLSLPDLSYQHITTTQQHKCVTITAGKWKVLWGKQTPLIHIAVWSTPWTQMSENIDSDRLFFLMPQLRDFRLPLIKITPQAKSLGKIMALLNWIILLIIDRLNFFHCCYGHRSHRQSREKDTVQKMSWKQSWGVTVTSQKKTKSNEIVVYSAQHEACQFTLKATALPETKNTSLLSAIPNLSWCFHPSSVQDMSLSSTVGRSFLLRAETVQFGSQKVVRTRNGSWAQIFFKSFEHWNWQVLPVPSFQSSIIAATGQKTSGSFCSSLTGGAADNTGQKLQFVHLFAV